MQAVVVPGVGSGWLPRDRSSPAGHGRCFGQRFDPTFIPISLSLVSATTACSLLLVICFYLHTFTFLLILYSIFLHSCCSQLSPASLFHSFLSQFFHHHCSTLSHDLSLEKPKSAQNHLKSPKKKSEAPKAPLGGRSRTSPLGGLAVPSVGWRRWPGDEGVSAARRWPGWLGGELEAFVGLPWGSSSELPPVPFSGIC